MSGFSFGGSAAPSSTPKFSFGSTPAPSATPAPAVSGGFSFGSTPAPSATPAPAVGGGFSFGSTPAATPAPAAGGGFSFGTTDKKDDAPKPAPVAGGGFSFGNTEKKDEAKPAPAAAKDEAKAPSPATGGTLTITSTPAKIEAPPKTYQNQTLEQIINSFSASLEESTVAYLAQARRVAQQDALLRDSQRNISHLSTEVTKLLIQQEELDLRLTQIGDVQNNLDSCMDGLEAQIDTLFERTMTNSGVEDADLERERYFDLAIQTEGRMTHLENVVENMEKNLQELQNNALGGGDLGNILQIMNRQQDMLTSLETSCARIEADMNLVGRKLTG